MSPRIVVRLLLLTIGCGGVHDARAATDTDPWPPPSPYRILNVATDGPPRIDAAGACLPDGGTNGPEAALAEAIEAARSSAAPNEAITRISRALTPGASERGRACAELELARLRLRSGFLPEARTHARRALRAFADAEAPGPIQRAARFHRAESFYLSNDIEAATPLYAALEAGATPVARAARIRLADIEHHERGDRESLLQLAKLLEEAIGESFDPSAWGPRLAEAALPHDPALALVWLERASPSLTEVQQTAVSVRRADLLRRTGEPLESREALRDVADGARTAASRQLAVVRAIDLDHRRDDGSRRQLERATSSTLPGLRGYARGILARQHIEAGDPGSALEVLVRLVHDGTRHVFVPSLRTMFDQVVGDLASAERCDDVVVSIGGRRDLLMRNVSTPDPLLHLGDCYLELGLGDAALDTYRSVAKVFGPSAVSRVTLRIARAEQAVGRHATARAATRASVSQNAEPVSAWRLLHAEILFEDDEAGDALETLEPVLTEIIRSDGASDTRERALLLASRAAARAGASTAQRELLTRALETGPEPIEGADRLAETAMRVADLQRAAGHFFTASALYERALHGLPPGPLRSRAIYWLGVLAAHDDDRSREIWSRIANEDDTWARLAANEIGLADGRAAVGAASRILQSRPHIQPPGDSP